MPTTCTRMPGRSRSIAATSKSLRNIWHMTRHGSGWNPVCDHRANNGILYNGQGEVILSPPVGQVGPPVVWRSE